MYDTDTDIDLSFLAPPGELTDWRMILLVDAADGSGVLEALPGTPGRWPTVWASTNTQWRRSWRRPLLAGPGGAWSRGRGRARPPRPLSAAVGDGPVRPPGEHRLALRPNRLRPSAGSTRWPCTPARRAPEAADACLAHAPAAVIPARPGRRPRRVRPQVRPPRPERHHAGQADDDRHRAVPGRAGGRRRAAVRRRLFEVLPAGSFDLVFCSGVTNTFGAGRTWPSTNVSVSASTRAGAW